MRASQAVYNFDLVTLMDVIACGTRYAWHATNRRDLQRTEKTLAAPPVKYKKDQMAIHWYIRRLVFCSTFHIKNQLPF